MKKKGLIISTVVMVVVLIASLTTATYAWFTAASTVQVNPISLAVRSETNVQVGVKYQNFNVANDATNYYNNSITATSTDNTVSWNGTDTGLGSTLEFPELKLGGSNAIGTSNYGSNWSAEAAKVDDVTAFLAKNTVVDNANNNKKYIVAARGKANTAAATGNKTTIDYSNDGVKLAAANKDYLNATIGVAANRTGVNGFYAKITVLTDGLDKTLGVNAAIHFVIRLGDKYIDVQPFGNLRYNTVINNTTITGENGGKLKVVDGTKAQSEFYFWIGKKTGNNTYKNDLTEIVDFDIYTYIDGTDDDCVLTSKGGCTIAITFGGTTYDATEGATQFTKLEDTTNVSDCKFYDIATTGTAVPSLA